MKLKPMIVPYPALHIVPTVPTSIPKGSRIYCENGHYRAKLVFDIAPETENWGRCIGDWQQDEPELESPLPIRCEKCSGIVIRLETEEEMMQAAFGEIEEIAGGIRGGKDG